jgi:hypothetical protein
MGQSERTAINTLHSENFRQNPSSIFIVLLSKYPENIRVPKWCCYITVDFAMAATSQTSVSITQEKCNFNDIAQWLERLTANAVVATVLGSISASSDRVESEGRQMKQC